MAHTQASIIDADAHVIETAATWEYLEGTDKKFRPQLVGVPGDASKQYWIIDGKVAGPPLLTQSDEETDNRAAKSSRKIGTPAGARKLEDIDLRLRHMTELGVDIQVLHNSMFIEQVTERPDIEYALCRSWNRWLADVWKEGGGRLRWTCVVPTLSLDAAEEELRFAKEHGAVGICLPPFDRSLMMLDPYFYPLYSVAEELDLAVIVHVANNDPTLIRALRSRYNLLDGFSSFRVPVVVACYGIVGSDIPAKFPNIRWGFVEASAQWVPWVMHELERRRSTRFDRESNPFVTNNVFVTTQIGDDYEYIVDSVGDDVLVIGTDYGHTDPASEVDAISQFRSLDVREDLKAKVLSTNPARLYAIT